VPEARWLQAGDVGGELSLTADVPFGLDLDDCAGIGIAQIRPTPTKPATAAVDLRDQVRWRRAPGDVTRRDDRVEDGSLEHGLQEAPDRSGDAGEPGDHRRLHLGKLVAELALGRARGRTGRLFSCVSLVDAPVEIVVPELLELLLHATPLDLRAREHLCKRRALALLRRQHGGVEAGEATFR